MSNAIIQRLASYLSVNETRSGEAIGNELGCSRTAVWKHVESLRALGIEVDAIAGQGYLLREPLVVSAINCAAWISNRHWIPPTQHCVV